ncbi:aldehyde dehydrogenase [Amycolatopsis acidicola]|uniref:Aldehyde dehydrogenase n=1 Tax=Amycolatopsis acidicola TaxID=2596893 RepID=A0A5N0V7P1_9PSEU|nr:aldehyde dehydrogenase [Amycolatopsis acidicola]KAA9160522.1 aldehyde dehydrogenase [Amycolatopsis acidicola]
MASNEAALFIGGELRAAKSAARIGVVNPATEETIGSIADASAEDVDQAVQSAAAAFDGAWGDTTGPERAAHLRALANELEARGDRIAAAVTAQNGMPLAMSQYANDILPVESYRYFADLAEKAGEEEIRPSRDGSTTVLRREPIGVAGLIVPWNGPHTLLAWKLGAALAAGCTVVFKAAPETSLDLPIFAEAVQAAGIPAGVINYVTGGAEAGRALVRHPGVGKIAFTGSSAAGREIAAACGEALKPVTLELGGKSAAILLDDVDLPSFTANIPVVCIPNSGQICYSSTRVLAPRSRYAEAVEAIAAAAAGLTVGDPLDEKTMAGPLVNKRQLERVQGYVELGSQEGAKLVTGGGRPDGLSRGYFLSPTVFSDVDNGMRVAQEEIFGPVLTVIPYEDEQEAVRIANDSAYGLGGTVFTQDPERGQAIARKVRTGTIGVNRYAIPLDAPFGGVKASGLGRELGPEGLAAYQQVKALYL